ncbi:MAG: hypothetical protein JWO31_1592 [Phycisphaerales bacterium]|nr:hypothetical protein [Phycisphaerales bacterium]
MTIYPIELDVHLVFDPPMDEKSPGIVVTRRIELPFVPFEGLRVHCRAWDDCSEPHGLSLKEVVWDMDRGTFLAESHHIHESFPIASIPDEVRTWVARGWRPGSWKDWYEEREAADGPDGDRARPADWLIDGDHPEFERLHLLPPDQRPAVFNRFWKSLIRLMIEDYSSLSTAYAMDKAGTWKPEGDERAAEAWHRFAREFARMGSSERSQWLDRVRGYPDVYRVLRSKPSKRPAGEGVTLGGG